VPHRPRSLHQVRDTLHALNAELNGNPAKLEVGEKTRPTVSQRLSAVERTIYRSLYGPTATAQEQLELARQTMGSLRPRLNEAVSALDELGEALLAAGAPHVEGASLD
jgi:hypothetical protein